ncbi:MAG TPA: site-specific integrase [Pyrinomonadaceae bacterium]|jgi:integrase|nr:site-specific integrase [Pyrinomonadaceae bacterium]
MPRIRKGTEVEKNGKWYGRVRYTTLEGKRKDLWLPAKNKSEASELVQKKLHELKTVGEQAIDGDKIKFSDLAKIYKEKKLIPAQYVGERKVAGLRSYQNPVRFLATLTDYFGNRRIKTITHSSIEEYKLMRLNLPTKRGQRQIASVNRELELLRAILKYAVREGWILRSPFEMGASLISKADETRRERILTHEEERRLLNACTGRYAHLKPLIIAALNTGCRRGELFKLKWQQVDLSSNIISILAMNSKTARPRLLPITPQLNWELEKLWQASNQDSENLVFGILDTVKKSWKSVCRIAEIEGLRFHDLRHTAITRMVQAGIASAIVMKLSGHTQHATFARYVNPNSEAIASAAEMLAAFNSQQGTQEALELVN